MRYRRLAIVITGVSVLALSAVAVSAQDVTCQVDEPFCFERSAHVTSDTLTNIKMPDIAVPLWLNQPTIQSNGDIE